MSGLESIEIFSEIIPVEAPMSEAPINQNEIAGPLFLSATDAIVQFDNEISEDPILKLSRDAKAYYDSGNYDAAYDVYWQILQMNTFNREVLFETYKNLGNIFLRDGDFDEAEELFDKACTINSKSDILLVNYGVLEIQRHNLDKARDRFRSAIKINTKNDAAWTGLAMVHREYGDQELSWANLERALDENIANETALRIAMDWGLRDNNLNKVAPRILIFISQVRDTTEMRISLAKILFCSGNYMAALEQAKAVLEKEASNAEAARLVSVIESEVL